MAVFCLFSLGKEEDYPLLISPPGPSGEGPTLVTSLNLYYPLKALSSSTDTLGLWASAYEFWGGIIHSRAVPNGKVTPPPTTSGELIQVGIRILVSTVQSVVMPFLYTRT